MRRLLSIIILLVGLTAKGADPETLLSRAGRAFDASEWASANALYNLVSDARPTDAFAYGRAVVSALMRGDTTATSEAVERAMANHVPLDSVLAVVERETLALGEGELYVGELHRIGAELPYLRRPVDARLLRYYTFRADAPGIIRYSQELLRGLPDSPVYLCSLAKGYLLAGDDNAACEAWQRALAADPRCLEALIGLGNTLVDKNPEEALPYIERANAIHPTPYLQGLINRLTGTK